MCTILPIVHVVICTYTIQGIVLIKLASKLGRLISGSLWLILPHETNPLLVADVLVLGVSSHFSLNNFTTVNHLIIAGD